MTFDISPIGFLNNARVWLEIYRKEIVEEKIDAKIIAVYCLHVSVEMYMKAKLISLEKAYSSKKVLK